MAVRQVAMGNYEPRLIHDGHWSGEVQFFPERLDEPLHWRKPSRVFVCSMGDLFHEDVEHEWRDQVFAVMAACPQHTFLVLTKRPKRANAYISMAMYDENCGYDGWYEALEALGVPDASPMENVWLGVTAEDQQRADLRIPVLLETPAARRFVSIEPCLSAIDLRPHLFPKVVDDETMTRGFHSIPRLDHVICGGETGPGARPMHPDWARLVRDQCQAAGVPFFLKSATIDGKLVKMPLFDGRRWAEVPDAV
jgi:protein gp37